MRYMILHKTNAHWETGPKPTPELIQRVGAMVGAMAAAGILKGGDGLLPSSQGARVRLSKGDAKVTPGPIPGAGALPARYAMFRAATLEQAADHAARFGRIFGDVTVDVRPVTEAWDLGFGAKPEGLDTRRYMAVVNADPVSESGAPLTADQMAALKVYTDDLTRAGAFLAVEHFEASSKGKRIQAEAATGPGKAKRVILDGPFSETKELIGGFVMVEVPGMEEALKHAQDYIACVDTDEVEVRGVVDA